jgi:hypothetical protein
MDPFNKALDRGASDFDQRQRVAAAIIWQIPFGSNLTGNRKKIADNWSVSTTFNAQTGTPFSIFDCSNGYTNCPRASFAQPQSKHRTRDMVDLSSVYGANTYSYMSLPQFYNADGSIDATNYNEQLNPLAGNTSDMPICSPAGSGEGCHFVTGMTGRNAFQGPGSWTENLGIVKDIKLHDRYDLQFKGEFINVLNHANTFLTLPSDVSTYTDILAYKGANSTGSIPGNRNTELSVHLAF